ncbi:lytic murein transglycosylase [Roseospira goensis]|uniref:Membrane-bound lytic murein transglycosylase B n=1 Tax=Roseospira goensis TaxID=391922 RepID=A0A7W6RWW2_9PROT|nr:lytic murein transglycosylase [Roseospira goensis]MBB4284734.1 membrane-bound lytic murein transglycosylase B [Roseospira goensis]
MSLSGSFGGRGLRASGLGIGGALAVALVPAALLAAEPSAPTRILQTPAGAESAQTQVAQTQDFQSWLDGVRSEAVRRGIAAATVNRAFQGVAPNDRVIDLDRRQPEFTQTFWGYFDRAVSETRVEEGRAMLARHGPLLRRVAAETGVPAHVLVAFWGLETNYGGNLGGFNVIEALATLAWDGRRGAFFREQLLTALEIIDQGHIDPARMLGSWAGAMGQMQFMPTTFRDHAVDYDGDGRKDIWGTLADAFGSAGRFLSNLGWRQGELWGRQVRLPAGFDHAQSDLGLRQPLAAWAALGVRRADGGPLPVVEGMSAALLLPAGHEGPAFLVYDNFRIIMRWNNSSVYALAVGRLADRIGGDGPLVGTFDRTPEPLRHTEVRALQGLLNRLGYDAGPVDGLVGPGTRGAIRRFQAAQGLPADGHADPDLLRRVQGAVGRLD